MLPAHPPAVPPPDPGLAPVELPVLVLATRQAVWLDRSGTAVVLTMEDAARRALSATPLLCHAGATARRLGVQRFPCYDLLELFTFVRPGRPCLPTPKGLARTLGLPVPKTSQEQAVALRRAAAALLAAVSHGDVVAAERSDPVAIAWRMGQHGWPWASAVLAALGAPHGPGDRKARTAFDVWEKLPEWAAEAPMPPPGQIAIDPAEAQERLAVLLTGVNRHQAAHADPHTVFRAEPRPQQVTYAGAVCHAFVPRNQPDSPNLVLAEAGTGVGKTLGYLAPASLWAERNKGAVWISTYTRNLQHQLDHELDRLYPDRAAKARKVVIRKGRENYLCLLNYEEACRQASLLPQSTVAMGLMARWIGASRDGDFGGSDFPGWLIDLLGPGHTLALADRRGECVYSACDHYNRCFIERSIRQARRADLVVANHALVLVQTALGGVDDLYAPTRYVFDEGHHVFAAADAAFAARLTARECADLRRWLLGAEGNRRSRARGLRKRLEELIGDDGPDAELLHDVLRLARLLPGEGWSTRLLGPAAGSPDHAPRGAAERFFGLVRQQVLARARGIDTPFTLEAETRDPIAGLLEAADALAQGLHALAQPLKALSTRLAQRLDDEADELDADQRRRIDGLARSIRRRGVETLTAWQAMLISLRDAGTVAGTTEETPTCADVVDWFMIERSDGREYDLGLLRHLVDPAEAFARLLGRQAHGLVITSATLTDGGDADASDWEAADLRTGAAHLPAPPHRIAVASPFDYGAQARVFIVTDVRRDDPAQVAAAYRSLFLASGGGALGLFTAVGRLRAVHQQIAPALEAAGLPVLAQHLDGLDVATLIDIFRAEEHSCLLGTDAVRDGIDVPGWSLRSIVFDRVPWPRPDILHKARRERFGGGRYDDMLTRLRLKQAFGRLVRRADDRGVFVLLDSRMPTRLCTAFPAAITIERVGLADAVAATRSFLGLETAS